MLFVVAAAAPGLIRGGGGGNGYGGALWNSNAVITVVNGSIRDNRVEGGSGGSTNALAGSGIGPGVYNTFWGQVMVVNTLLQDASVGVTFAVRPALIAQPFRASAPTTFVFTLTGDVGAAYEIQTSSTGYTWTRAATLTNTFGTIQVSNSMANGSPLLSGISHSAAARFFTITPSVPLTLRRVKLLHL